MSAAYDGMRNGIAGDVADVDGGDSQATLRVRWEGLGVSQDIPHAGSHISSDATQREREVKRWKSTARIRDLLSSRQSPAPRD